MKQLKNVKEFMFESAQYYVSNDGGDKIILQVDYKNNEYYIKEVGGVLNPAFRKDISVVAADLLQRKHGTNFAKRISR
jgi:hypothetical protein